MNLTARHCLASDSFPSFMSNTAVSSIITPMSNGETFTMPYTSRLHRVLVERLSLDEFRLMCFDLEYDYDLLVRAGKSEQILEFIQIMKREKKLELVVTYCRAQYTDIDWDTELAATHSTLTMVLPAGAEGESVTRGLEALSELMALPEARTAVITFRHDFETVISQIDILSDYKRIHDLLHNLEYQCLSGLQRATRYFPDDEEAIFDLEDNEQILSEIIFTASDIQERPTFRNDGLPWINELERARTTLLQAIETEDPQQLKRAIWLIDRVIAIQPSQINTRLNTVARTLRLQVLVQAMTSIYETLENLNMDRQKLDQFATGAMALSKLRLKLEELIEAHDAWQALMLELNRVERVLEQDLFELEMSWPDIRLMLAALLPPPTTDNTAETNEPDAWAADFYRDMERLDEVLSAANPARVRRYFARLDSQAGKRFYLIDIDLRRLCED
ncbi:MAG: hypothetical protein KDD89_05880, partial [Anaerolineales bacterium]|nr:hypothetical protein [Anaerolineales bacterium]